MWNLQQRPRYTSMLFEKLCREGNLDHQIFNKLLKKCTMDNYVIGLFSSKSLSRLSSLDQSCKASLIFFKKDFYSFGLVASSALSFLSSLSMGEVLPSFSPPGLYMK
jgi:hypothetical protein